MAVHGSPGEIEVSGVVDMSSWMQRLNEAKVRVAENETDPLREKVELVVRGMEAVSTAALLDLVGLPNTTGNARRISRTMRGLGYVPITSRRFMPGGWRDTVTRGWARPVRDAGGRGPGRDGSFPEGIAERSRRDAVPRPTSGRCR